MMWGRGGGSDTQSGYYYSRPFAEVRKLLLPLMQRLRDYDATRVRLEREGGTAADLQLLTGCLSNPISIDDRSQHHRAVLTEPDELRQVLKRIGAKDLYFSVRVRPSGLPAYYVVRAKHGYWSEYSLLVEDLYRSPEYPSPDERFVKLMDWSHETYFLRLSQFREGVSAGLPVKGAESERKADGVLHDVGRQVFQAAWHEDQYAAFQVAEVFQLPLFRQAIELLYLCLSGDLCAIRASLDDDVSEFFVNVYPQPAIHALLARIGELDGKGLAELPEDAGDAYRRLTASFERFLRVEVRHGSRASSLPLYKLIYANFGRLDMITPTVTSCDGLSDAGAQLEELAAQVIFEITGVHPR